MPERAELYQQDFYRWTEQQAAALRQAAQGGTNLPLDWENLAEEIESLGASQRNELSSRLGTIIEHLLKLEHSPARNPRRGWTETVARERSRIEPLLENSPSLRREIAGMIAKENVRMARLVSRILFGYGEASEHLSAPNYTEEQVLGDWFPEPRHTPPGRAGRGGARKPSRGAS